MNVGVENEQSPRTWENIKNVIQKAAKKTIRHDKNSRNKEYRAAEEKRNKARENTLEMTRKDLYEAQRRLQENNPEREKKILYYDIAKCRK